MRQKPTNVLGDETRPRFFPVAGGEAVAGAVPAPRRGLAVRASARSLEGMQKEALIANSLDGRVWRLVSDEGPYLDGHDEAPFPLAHMTTGMVASYMSAFTALAEQRGIALHEPRLTLHSRYSMEGSARKGTMLGGALAPELEVEAETDAGADALRALAADAVRAAPVDGLVRGVHDSLFTLTSNDRRLHPERVRELAGEPAGDPRAAFEPVEAADDAPQPLVELVTPAEEVEGTGGAGSSYAEHQSRTLHVEGVCTVREDGVKEIEQHLHQPIGSVFRFLSDEPSGAGGRSRAPDAATYVSAGIAFCFMTQLGRYARIMGSTLDRYRLVQDTHLSLGTTGRPGEADPVETHVHLDTPDGDDFARRALDMSEQTCFLHALCRTALETSVRVAVRA